MSLNIQNLDKSEKSLVFLNIQSLKDSEFNLLS